VSTAKKIADHDYVASVWFERGDGYVELSTPKGRQVFHLDHEGVCEAIDDGFLTMPRLARMSSRSLNSASEWQPHLVKYARERGLIP
jgi:hypothetical protein